MSARGIVLVIGALFAACAGLVAGARALGGTQTPPPTYLETGPDCAQPCWRGLRPGVHTRDQFLQQVAAVSPFTGRVSDYGDGIAAQFELQPFGALTLADALRAFGAPERVSCLGIMRTTFFAGRSTGASARLYFADGLIMVEVVRPDETLRLSPDMLVRAVRYFAPGEPVYPIGATQPWRGFTSTQAYNNCQP